jgi:hypothetical protein
MKMNQMTSQNDISVSFPRMLSLAFWALHRGVRLTCGG